MITYHQYKRFSGLSVDQLMADHFFTVGTAIEIFNECRRIHSIEYGPINQNHKTTRPDMNRKIEAAEVAHYE